jgi:hypothetical protein
MTDITPDFKAMQDNVRRFWDTQDRLLDNMEKFADGWFKRRHVASHAAQEAAQRMCKAQNPVDVVHEYQDWVTGSFQRVMDDCFASQQFVGACAGLLQDAPPQQPEKKPPPRSKVADLNPNGGGS